MFHSQMHGAMKKILMFMILAGMTLAAVAKSLEAKLGLSTTGPVYVNQVVTLQLALTAHNVAIAQVSSIENAPDKRILRRLGTFRETTSVDDNKQKDRVTITYTQKVQAVRPTDTTFHPILNVRLIERTRTPFGTTQYQRSVSVRAKPFRLQIIPPPEKNKPDNYCGLVGPITYNVQVSPTKIAVGDLVTIERALTAESLLPDIQLSELTFSDRFRVYPAREETREPQRLVIKQTVVPLSTNAVEIPSSTIPYLNPRTGTYAYVKQGPFALSFRERETAPVATHGYKPEPPLSPNPTSPVSPDTLPTQRSTDMAIRHTAALALIPLGILLAATAGIRIGRARAVAGSIAALLIVTTSIGASFFLRGSTQTKSLVRLARATTARIAPSPAAFSHFTLKANTPITIVETTPRWVKVLNRGRTGWIETTALKKRSNDKPPTEEN